MNMNLLFCNTILGEITGLYGDQPWWGGKFHPNPEAAQFQEFFAWMVDEEKNNFPTDPPFAREWWTDDNWFVEDAEHGRRPISVPAIYEDHSISFRFR